MTIKNARSYLEKRDKELTAKDFMQSVCLVTSDCVLLFFDGALTERREEFYFIWTEHHGNFIEHKDEVQQFWVS